MQRDDAARQRDSVIEVPVPPSFAHVNTARHPLVSTSRCEHSGKQERLARRPQLAEASDTMAMIGYRDRPTRASASSTESTCESYRERGLGSNAK